MARLGYLKNPKASDLRSDSPRFPFCTTFIKVCACQIRTGLQVYFKAPFHFVLRSHDFTNCRRKVTEILLKLIKTNLAQLSLNKFWYFGSKKAGC